MTYAEKLKDVRWQQKRLKIFERDNWTCRYCQLSDGGLHGESLHAHHLVYKWNFDPWDYHNDYIITLCSKCHENEEYDKKFFKEMIEKMLLHGDTHRDILQVIVDGWEAQRLKKEVQNG